MLGYESEQRLKNLLVATGDGERLNESYRQRLCNIRDFAPHAGFQRIDRNGSGFVSSRELHAFLLDNGVYGIAEHELHQLVRFFDSDVDGMLSHQDYLQIILPCEDNLLRNITLDRPSYRVGRYEYLPRDIELAMVEVIQREIDLQRRLDTLKRDLEVRYDFTSLGAYRSVDRYNDGRIDTYNLGTFLRQQGHFASERELLSIIRRIDTDGDARLSYSETAEFLRSGGSAVIVEPRLGRSISPSRRDPVLTRTSPLKTRSPVRPSTTRHVSFATPVRRSSPVRTSPIRQSPVRQSLPRYSSPVRKPILGLYDEDELVRALKEYVELERELESAKTSLTLKSDFNLFDLFNLLDTNRNGQVSSYEIRDGLAAVGVYPTSDEIDLFIQRYDRNGDRRLNFSEIQDAFVTFDTYYASMLQRRGGNDHRRPVYRREDIFFADTLVELRNMWRVHFKVENHSEHLRQRLTRSPSFNLYEAFNSCDINDSGAVSRDELRRLLESRGFFVTEKDVSQLTDKLDKNKNGLVSYSEFRDEMHPRSPVRH